MKLKIITLIFISLFTYSCSFILQTTFGIKKINYIDSSQYKNFVNQVSNNELNTIDIQADSSFLPLIAQYGVTERYKKHLMQPMQAFLFKNNDLIFYVANCLVPPKFPNLNWNYQNKFAYFPPISTCNLDSVGVDLNTIIKHKSDLKNTTNNFKYVYFINWNLMTERQSRNLIKEIQQNILKFNKQDSTLIILNNTDCFYIKADIEF